MKARFSRGRQESILQVLVSKYEADPEGFSSYLPEIAHEIEESLTPRRSSSHSLSLTELERERLKMALVQLLGERETSREKAIQALEYCATLIQDESLPIEVTRQTSLGLLQRAIGIPLSRVKGAIRIPVYEGEATKEIAIVYGVHLHLTWNDRLVAISISPAKAKERSKALKFMGIAKDSASDVSKRHDAYFSEGVLGANS